MKWNREDKGHCCHSDRGQEDEDVLCPGTWPGPSAGEEGPEDLEPVELDSERGDDYAIEDHKPSRSGHERGGLTNRFKLRRPYGATDAP